MILYLFAIFILALGFTLWSMRGFGKKHTKVESLEPKQGSIVIMDEKVQHYQ
ncbi:hypothetical protein KBB12_00290 [Candidatus Woesebacteria bacterium]|nr:hypothetical protein [Candidatus Woesebacteria bacterium]